MHARHASAGELMDALLDANETLIRHLGRDMHTCSRHGDIGTRSFLTELRRRHEEVAGTLRNHLEA